jgi:hypothetical protein
MDSSQPSESGLVSQSFDLIAFEGIGEVLVVSGFQIDKALGRIICL